MKIINRLFFICIIILALSDPGISSQNDPVEMLKERDKRIKDILGPKGKDINDNQKKELKGIINEVMDFERLASDSLGSFWDGRSEDERSEFIILFRGLIEKNSITPDKLDAYRTQEITYLKTERQDGEAIVHTSVMVEGRDLEAIVVYKMHIVNRRWMVHDLIIDDVSLMEGYRSQFNKIITRHSYEELVSRMKERLEE